jgi:BirA family biotin operon repressor/biotin-[acetyl-CoA-carboxylase] ligase
MAGAAVAVCETLRFYGVKPTIKWANDVFVDGKKICGILIENTLSGSKISSSIVGVGLNVNTTFQGELAPIATSMFLATGKTFSVEEVTEKLVEELFKVHTMDDYRAYLGLMGERVTLLLGDERVPATLLSVDDAGRLVAEIDGERRVFSSAEVSVRI